jgi:hypothetical protein
LRFDRREKKAQPDEGSDTTTLQGLDMLFGTTHKKKATYFFSFEIFFPNNHRLISQEIEFNDVVNSTQKLFG